MERTFYFEYVKHTGHQRENLAVIQRNKTRADQTPLTKLEERVIYNTSSNQRLLECV